jgi:hypothetical protein
MSRIANMNPFGPAALFGVGGLQGGVEDEEQKLLRLKAQQAAMPQVEQARLRRRPSRAP